MTEISSLPTLSDNAAKRVASLAAAEKEEGAFLRLTVSGGGCAGFQYQFALEHKPHEGDIVVEKNGATLVVDEVSLPFLQGAEIDFIDNLMGSYFQVKNPNAETSCGCGTSFSVKF
ncbi:MAG: iron-sulfur cluster insertion protein ErpA [Alphaproteobacteria bacterium]